MNRVDKIAAKIGHPLLDVRMRAASNLLSKLENKLIDSHDIGHYIELIIDVLNTSFENCLRDMESEKKTVNTDQLFSIHLNIMYQLFQYDAPLKDFESKFSETLRIMYVASTKEGLHTSLRDKASHVRLFLFITIHDLK